MANNLGIQVTCVIEDAGTIEKKLKQVLQNVHASIKIDDIDIDKQALESKIQGLIKLTSGLGSELKQSFSGIPLTELQQALNMVNQIQQKQLNKVSITTDKSGNTTKTVTDSTDEYGRQVKVVETLNEKLETTTTNYQKQRQEAEKLAQARMKLEKQVDDFWQKALYDREQKEKASQENLANQMGNGREKSQINSNTLDKKAELAQAQAINKAMDERYKLEKSYDDWWQKALQNRETQQQKEMNDLANQMGNGRENAELKNNQVDRKSELEQANAINKALEEQYNENLKLAEAMGKVREQSELKSKSQESKSDLAQIQAQNKALEEQALLKQRINSSMPTINEKINALQSNGVLNQADLSDVTNKASNIKTAQDLEAVNSQLSALKTKEGNILSVSKALEKLSSDADLLKNKYKSLVPDSEFIKFKGEINSATAELKKMEGTNFNGLKNQVNELRKTFDSLQSTAKSSGVQLANQDSRSLLGYLTGSALKFSAWLGIGNVVMTMVNGFKDGVGYVKQMDDAMTNIQMITSKSKDEVQGLKQEYSELAGQLHTTNSEIMAGAEELLRAGKTSQETKQMLTASSVGSAISGQTTANVSEQLIAISNGFKINADDIMHVIDVISQLDNTSSTSFQEVATAMKYTSASAQGVGVSFENLASYIATVSSISRKSASSIGESFKFGGLVA